MGGRLHSSLTPRVPSPRPYKERWFSKFCTPSLKLSVFNCQHSPTLSLLLNCAPRIALRLCPDDKQELKKINVSTFIFSFVRQHGSVNAVTNCIYTKTYSTWLANVVPKKHGILPQSRSPLRGLFTEINWVAKYSAHSSILPGYNCLESLVYNNSTSRIEWNTYFLQEHNQSISMSGENYRYKYPNFQQWTSHIF